MPKTTHDSGLKTSVQAFDAFVRCTLMGNQPWPQFQSGIRERSIIISRDCWRPVGSNMTGVHLLPQAKFEFKDSSMQHKIAWYAAFNSRHLTMHETIFCQRPNFLAATSNLREEQNLVHLGRFLHFSQKVVGVTLMGLVPTLFRITTEQWLLLGYSCEIPRCYWSVRKFSARSELRVNSAVFF